MKKPKDQPQPVMMQPLDLRVIRVTLVGLSPLLCHRFNPKSFDKMLAKQQGAANVGREKRDPKADFLGSLYPLPRPVKGCKYGMPTIAFKKAAVVGAGRFMESMKMTVLRGAFHIREEMVPVKSADGPVMHESVVRNANGVADLRFRAKFPTWSVEMEVEFNARVLSLDQLLHAFEMGGFGVGVGDWRPERDGTYGRFAVKR